MAAIDKIYGTRSERTEFINWCTSNFPEALPYFYQEWNDDEIHPITNFPIEIDMQLLKICPIKWVTDRIKDQYDITSEE